jgi:hypothetical protein
MCAHSFTLVQARLPQQQDLLPLVAGPEPLPASPCPSSGFTPCPVLLHQGSMTRPRWQVNSSPSSCSCAPAFHCGAWATEKYGQHNPLIAWRAWGCAGCAVVRGEGRASAPALSTGICALGKQVCSKSCWLTAPLELLSSIWSMPLPSH